MDGPKVIELAAELGAQAVNLSEYVPAGRGGLDLALSPEELRQVLGDWIELRARYKDVIQVIWHDCRVGMLVPEGEKRSYVGCGAGRLVARILPDGTVTPCVFLPTPIGTFREGTFFEMWTRSEMLRQFREREGHVTGNCGACEYLGVCGGCRAVAYAYSKGNPFAGDPHCWVKPDQIAQLAYLPDGEGLPA
jgi:radical SAM protein with 4Fe4S-binding SPASM domain